jgi:diaminopimelate decarboxylase
MNATLQNLVVCLAERKEFYAKHGGEYWFNQIQELKKMIKAQLDARAKSRNSYSKNATKFEAGHVIMDDTLVLITEVSETAKMMKFTGVDAKGNEVSFRRNKKTTCCYK